MGSTSYLGFSYPNLLLLNLLLLGTCNIFFCKCWDFFCFYFYLFLGQLVTTEIRFFALKSKKGKVPERDQNVF